MSTATVTDFLSLTNVGERVVEVGELAIRAAESSADFRRAFGFIASWWGNAYPQPERLLAVLYLKAHEHAGLPKLSGTTDVVKLANRAVATLRSLERRDVESAMARAESRIAASPTLTRRLAVAQDELQEIQSQMEEIARQLVSRLRDNGVERDTTDAVSTQADVTTQAWGCYLNGVRISCWLAVAIVLVAILLL